jgi:small subunit ribosomal protein S16
MRSQEFMLVIRLTRVGKKKQPSYRLVVQEKSKDPWGKAFEIVGQYNPRTNPKTINIKADRVKEWMSKGAQPSPSVHNLLVDAKIIAGEKVNATRGDKKKPAAAPEKKEEAKA